MYQYNRIRSLELEISSLCNAACPQCPRNIRGGATIDNLPLTSWTLEQLQSFLFPDFVNQLEQLYFCGTYGDPMTNRDVLAMAAWLRSINPNLRIGIHTNGGVGNRAVYRNLAEVVDFIAFGIDGLEDTNHIYRRNVNWQKLIQNSTAFIENGGYAIWDFIVFRHNQHQVDHARNISQQLHFKEFNVKKTGRFFNKSHQMVGHLDVIDKKGKKEYIIEPPDAPYLNRAYDVLNKIDFASYVQNTQISCYWMNHDMLYIGADGYVFPCGFLHDRLYGVEAESNSDHKHILAMMQQAGGYEKANVFHTALADIVDGHWFARIKQSWSTDRLERCGLLCGEKVNLLADQNSSINYKNDLKTLHK